jgi:hypothetical protein
MLTNVIYQQAGYPSILATPIFGDSDGLAPQQSQQPQNISSYNFEERHA